MFSPLKTNSTYKAVSEPPEVASMTLAHVSSQSCAYGGLPHQATASWNRQSLLYSSFPPCKHFPLAIFPLVALVFCFRSWFGENNYLKAINRRKPCQGRICRGRKGYAIFFSHPQHDRTHETPLYGVSPLGRSSGKNIFQAFCPATTAPSTCGRGGGG